MANNILEVINEIEALELGFSAEKMFELTKEVLAHPERADSILQTLADLKEEKRDADEYADGAIEDFLKREEERKAAAAAVARQEKERDDALRRAAVMNIMQTKSAPVFGTPEFDSAIQAEYDKLRNGKNVCFDPSGGAFVYDMEKNHLTERQLELLEAAERDAQTSDEVIGSVIKELPNGKYLFNIVDVTEKIVDGVLRQTLRLEEEKTGYNVWLSWIIDKHVDPNDYKKTRRNQLARYSAENGDIFAGLTEKQAMDILFKSGIKAWAYTYANAKETEDGKKFAKLFLTEADYNYVVSKELAKAARAEEIEQRQRETKAGTWKFC